MKKLIWIPVFWPLFFSVFIASAFTIYSSPPFVSGEKKIWQIENMSGIAEATLARYSVTIEPEGYLTLVCPEAISSAKWSWQDDELTFHIRSEDPVLKTLGRSWILLENDEQRMRLKDMNGSLEVHLVSSWLNNKI